MAKVNRVNEFIVQANQRLKSAGIGIRIERVGNALYLRGSFPLPGQENSPIRKQQRIPLSRLDIKANVDGVKEAEKEAHKVSGLLARKEFSWAAYLRSKKSPSTVADWVIRFKQDYFSRRGLTNKTQTTWETDYLTVFKRLPDHLPLTAELLEEAIKETSPNSRNRRRWVLACQALANFAGLSVDFKPLRGSYSHRSVGERELPTDEQIAIVREQIKHPHWQWVYGVLAAYGVRPHEVFYLDWSEFPQLRVKDGKTGSRLVHPLYPEWATQWHLDQALTPACTGKTNRDLGQRVSQAFRRNKVPFAPYALRHCWAIRAIRFNMPIALAARMMGHSVEVHTQTYHRWITADLYHQEYQRLCDNPNRPTPPALNAA